MILIVDDDEIYAQGLKELLSRRGYKDIEIALNGDSGLTAILGKQPDLVILDIIMPVGENVSLAEGNPDGFSTGLVLLERMKAHNASMDNVLVISVRWESSIRQQLHDVGVSADNILTKPLEGRAILDNVRRLMRK
jgi:DNA-binding response OmpR family regulator